MSLSPGQRKRYAELLARPLFRCKGGWRNGATRISLATANAMLQHGLARLTTTRAGKPMLVGKTAAPASTPHTLPPPWWTDV